MAHQEERAQLRRRIGTTSVLLVGGAVVGASLASRRTLEPLGAAPDARDNREPEAEVLPESEHHVVAPADQAQQPPRSRRVPAILTYGIAVALVLGGLGLMGVVMASQHESPPAPQARSEVGPPAPDAAPDAAITPSRDGLRARSGPPYMAPARQERITEEPTPLTVPPSRPVALHIPAIEVRSVVRPLGLTDEEELETPSGSQYNDAGWYRHSPAPGSLGPSILLGHVDSAADGPSVFFRLGELRAGDRVRVARADGTVAVFSVDDVRRFAKKDFPTNRVYGDIEHAGLRILTCGGPFDQVSGHYLDNIIVFASLVDE